MKFGMRKPSLKKSFKARTTGRLKRSIKRTLIPWYGKKGMGILHPQKAIYNKVYKKTTFSIWDLFKKKKTTREVAEAVPIYVQQEAPMKHHRNSGKGVKRWIIAIIACLVIGMVGSCGKGGSSESNSDSKGNSTSITSEESLNSNNSKEEKEASSAKTEDTKAAAVTTVTANSDSTKQKAEEKSTTAVSEESSSVVAQESSLIVEEVSSAVIVENTSSVVEDSSSVTVEESSSVVVEENTSVVTEESSSVAPQESSSVVAEESSVVAIEESSEEVTSEPEMSYVINTNTGKFHYPGCNSVPKIKEENRWDYYGTRQSIIDQGFSPCGNCHP